MKRKSMDTESKKEIPENNGRKRRTTVATMPQTANKAIPIGIDHWVSNADASVCALTDNEQSAMKRRMYSELTRNKRPLPPPSNATSSNTPMLVVPVAAPGSGKSTVTMRFLRESPDRYDTESFVEIDLDDAIHFHPKGPDLWKLRNAATGKLLPVGNTETFFICRRQAVAVMRRVLYDLLRERRFHLVLHSVSGNILRPAKRLGWFTLLVFVSVPREIAERRARDRLPSTGRHFTAEDVGFWWEATREAVVGWSLWADEFYVIQNGADDAAKQRPLSVTRVESREPNPFGNDWYTPVIKAQQQIEELLGIPTGVRAKDAVRDLGLVSGTGCCMADAVNAVSN
jgi:hypothetical protein